MHFGEPIDDDRFIGLVRHAHEIGVRTFMTADVYGHGAADEMMGRALQGFARDSYSLVGMVGHDYVEGQRDGAKGYPRFTDPRLRSPGDYTDYLRRATEAEMKRCGTDHFDVVLLHNPDHIGYSQDSVWKGMQALKDEGFTRQLGIAPGPANGFTLDIIQCFERFGELVDWAMIILSPMEPWPGKMCLPASEKYGVDIITRVVDHGGIFHDDVKPGHKFIDKDHRVYRPPGWVEAGNEKLDRMRPIAEKHGLSMLQLACLWNLSHPSVKCVAPTFIQETGDTSRSIEEKVADMAKIPDLVLSAEEIAEIEAIGNNKGCMKLKGGSPLHQEDPVADQWSLDPDLLATAERWGIDPSKDLVPTH